jgi:hypothetical protein
MSDNPSLTPEEYEQLGRNPADANVVIEGATSDDEAPATPPEGVVEDDA